MTATRPSLASLGDTSARIVDVAGDYLDALRTRNPRDIDAAGDILWQTVNAVEGIHRLAVLIDLALLAAKMGRDGE